ncbi:hypothetical protein HGP14_33655 [Rhizobium sp. P32RR-XVIII]|uniref:hypothetical protein n=1 Tax=Rhizobium sp. P32RR-XVIII TaxID=2726738 RepID=UPI001456CBF4|nr:hypothetical protein [Rhizobium sp. P32RR-XVIII]NLS08143.1 hypothetical protein [Rhizobium sp. P32RR-XVIII]
MDVQILIKRAADAGGVLNVTCYEKNDLEIVKEAEKQGLLKIDLRGWDDLDLAVLTNKGRRQVGLPERFNFLEWLVNATRKLLT